MYNYGKHYVDNNDVQNIKNIINNDTFLTCGPKVNEFEKKIVIILSVNIHVL